MAKFTTTHSKYKGVVVSKTDMRKLNAKLEMKASEIKDFIVFRFKQIGEDAVKLAREVGGYHDITGNLRSSIGYVILVDGQAVVEGKPEQYAGKIGDGSKGVVEGQRFLNRLKAKFPWGVVLILCAGMEYAAFVENVKHKDVLTSAEHLAESLVEKLLGKLLQETKK